MHIKKLFVLLPALILFLIAACSEDPNTAAGKLFDEAKSYQADVKTNWKSYSQGAKLFTALDKLESAADKLNQIVRDYPASDLGKSLARGSGSQNQSVEHSEEALLAMYIVVISYRIDGVSEKEAAEIKKKAFKQFKEKLEKYKTNKLAKRLLAGEKFRAARGRNLQQMEAYVNGL